MNIQLNQNKDSLDFYARLSGNSDTVNSDFTKSSTVPTATDLTVRNNNNYFNTKVDKSNGSDLPWNELSQDKAEMTTDFKEPRQYVNKKIRKLENGIHGALDIKYKSKNGKTNRKAILRSPMNGVVTDVNRDPNRKNDAGKHFFIKEKNGYKASFSHNKEIYVKKGDIVKEGQTVSREGNTGLNSRGEHLHYKLRKKGSKVDPEKHNPGKYEKLEDTPVYQQEQFEVNKNLPDLKDKKAKIERFGDKKEKVTVLPQV